MKWPCKQDERQEEREKERNKGWIFWDTGTLGYNKNKAEDAGKQISSTRDENNKGKAGHTRSNEGDGV